MPNQHDDTTDETADEHEAILEPVVTDLEDEELEPIEDEIGFDEPDAEPEDREALEARMEELTDTSVSTADPVRQYLREIGDNELCARSFTPTSMRTTRRSSSATTPSQGQARRGG